MMKSKRGIGAFTGWLLFVTLFVTNQLQAQTIGLNLVINPPVTAFSGIPASGGFSGTSTQSGPGTWQLFAYDNGANSYGIRDISIKLLPGAGGSIPSIINRLPITGWSNGSGSFAAGFTDSRVAANNTVSGAQVSGSTNPIISGFGQTQDNFQTKIGSQIFFGTTNGLWGKYATTPDIPQSLAWPFRKSLFVAEGTYTGPAPTIDLRPNSQGGSYITIYNDFLLTTPVGAAIILMPEPTGFLLLGMLSLALFSFARRLPNQKRART